MLGLRCRVGFYGACVRFVKGRVYENEAEERTGAEGIDTRSVAGLRIGFGLFCHSYLSGSKMRGLERRSRFGQ